MFINLILHKIFQTSEINFYKGYFLFFGKISCFFLIYGPIIIINLSHE